MPPTRKLSQPVRPSAVSTPAFVLADDAAFSRALLLLEELDGSFVATMRAAGDLPRLRRRETGFAGLAAIVVSQQVSTASANAIFNRLQTAFPALNSSAIAAADDAELRACGLSASKARTLRAVAAAEDAGLLDFAALATETAEQSHARLCAIKGIGPWTADIFLLFCLGHSDAWPAGDLAVQEGARLALGLAERPDSKALHALGERWRPLRGVVAHCLWAFYGHKRGRAGTLAPTPNSTTTPTGKPERGASGQSATRTAASGRRRSSEPTRGD